MGDMAIYGYGTPFPLVDHPHDRTHQHQTIWRYLTHKAPDEKLYPNYPDVDIRDAVTEYLIDIEVPGVKDDSQITCQWTSMKSLIVSGNVARPEWKSFPKESTPETQKGTVHEHETYLLVGERRIGAFRRSFYFPQDVEMEKLSAKLEAGLLMLRVPKHGHALPKADGKIKINIQN